MKYKSILAAIVCSIFSCTYSEAQVHNFFVCGETGLGLGTHTSLKLALNAVVNKSIFTACFYHSSRRGPEVPADYDPFLWSDRETMDVFGLMYGRVIYTSNPYVRYTIKAGIGMGKVISPVDFVRYSGLLTNYTFTKREEAITALLLNPTVDLPFSRGFGLSCGLFANVNLVSPAFGIEGSLLFGYLRNAEKKHSR